MQIAEEAIGERISAGKFDLAERSFVARQIFGQRAQEQFCAERRHHHARVDACRRFAGDHVTEVNDELGGRVRDARQVGVRGLEPIFHFEFRSCGLRQKVRRLRGLRIRCGHKWFQVGANGYSPLRY